MLKDKTPTFVSSGSLQIDFWETIRQIKKQHINHMVKHQSIQMWVKTTYIVSQHMIVKESRDTKKELKDLNKESNFPLLPSWTNPRLPSHFDQNQSHIALNSAKYKNPPTIWPNPATQQVKFQQLPASIWDNLAPRDLGFWSSRTSKPYRRQKPGI